MTSRCTDFYDAELARHNRHLMAAADIAAHDRVLDIGCGAGQTTREAARIAAKGEAVGVDVSPEMLEVARRRCSEEGLRNVVFEQGDAQFHEFPAARFDLCISRFGVMFFADPAAAFANIGRAMRPGARLAWIVWQSQARNEWSGAIRQALGLESAIPADSTKVFSLGDPAVTSDLLQGAGFTAIDFADVHEPVFYGRNVDVAFDAVTSFQFVKDALARANEPSGEVSRRLCDLLQANLTAEGVLFDSRAWIITARRASG